MHQARVNVPVFNVEPFDGVPSMVAFPTTHRDHLHRRRPRPDRPERDLQGQRHRVDRWQGGAPGRRLAPGLQRPRRRRHLPDDAEPLHGRRRPDDDPERRLARRTAENRHAATSPPTVGTIGCNAVEFEPKVDVTSTGATDSPDPATVERENAVQPKPDGNGKLAPARCESRPPRRHQPQPVGRKRSRDLQRRAVREGNRQPDPVPRRFENRHRRGEIAGPGPAPRRQCLRRRAAEPESDLRRNVPDLHPRVQYTVWRQRPPGRERHAEPEHRSADCGRRQKPAAAVRRIHRSKSTAGRMAR